MLFNVYRQRIQRTSHVFIKEKAKASNIYMLNMNIYTTEHEYNTENAHIGFM